MLTIRSYVDVLGVFTQYYLNHFKVSLRLNCVSGTGHLITIDWLLNCHNTSCLDVGKLNFYHGIIILYLKHSWFGLPSSFILLYITFNNSVTKDNSGALVTNSKQNDMGNMCMYRMLPLVLIMKDAFEVFSLKFPRFDAQL